MGYAVVTYDYRGYGESKEYEFDEDRYLYAQFATDLETMITYCYNSYQQKRLYKMMRCGPKHGD